MEDHPKIRVKPPLVLLATMLVSGVVSFLAPAQVTHKRWLRLAGIPILAGGFGLLFSAVRQMIHAGTNIDPDLPAKTLVTGGPYRLTRNPIYLGLTLSYAGLGMLANTLWFLPFAVAFMAILQTQVIHFEESYLENKFGMQYRQYKESVGRWI